MDVVQCTLFCWSASRTSIAAATMIGQRYNYYGL